MESNQNCSCAERRDICVLNFILLIELIPRSFCDRELDIAYPSYYSESDSSKLLNKTWSLSGLASRPHVSDPVEWIF